MSAADLLNIPWTHQSVDAEVAAVNCFAKCNRPSICSKHINLIVPPLASTSLIVFTGGRYLVLHTCQGSIWQDVDIIFERPGREVEPGDFSKKGEINQGQTHHNDVRACFIVLLPNKVNEWNYCCSHFVELDLMWYRFRWPYVIQIQTKTTNINTKAPVTNSQQYHLKKIQWIFEKHIGAPLIARVLFFWQRYFQKQNKLLFHWCQMGSIMLVYRHYWTHLTLHGL